MRLNQETQGIVAEKGNRRMVILPQGCEIALLGHVAGHPEMVKVRCDGQTVWLFAIDFEARTSDETPPFASATSVGDTPEPDKAKVQTNTRGKTVLTPRVRRFNAAGREVF